METITLAKDTTVFYVTASSFPEGVLAAHQKLHSMIPFSTDRNYYAFSRPEKGSVITYRAAAEEKFPGEGATHHCETLVLKKGKYLAETVHDFMNNIPAIGQLFEKLISLPGLDPQGYCVEWYINDKDVTCMIRLAD